MDIFDIILARQGNSGGGGGDAGGGVFVINDNNGTLDKTWQEIYDAFTAKKVAIIYIAEVSAYYVCEVNHNTYYNVRSNGVSKLNYIAESADGYPYLDD